ncbi:hypothetical protein GCM10023238_14570 [Streptomyces heliomycini]
MFGEVVEYDGLTAPAAPGSPYASMPLPAPWTVSWSGSDEEDTEETDETSLVSLKTDGTSLMSLKTDAVSLLSPTEGAESSYASP